MNSKSESHMNKDTFNLEKLEKERKHVCAVCRKGFMHKSHLDTHLLSHSEEKPYQCTTCNQQFKQKAHLIIHMLTHSRNKRHECPTCQKGFTRKQDVNRHMSCHSGEKPYQCTTCNNQFVHKHNLKEHLRIHSGDKPFGCPTCSQKFRRKSYLNKHMIIHSKKKQNTSESEQNLKQNSLLIDKSSLEANDLEKVNNTFTEYESKPSTSMTHFGNVKEEIEDGLEQNNSDFSFEVPLMIEESNPEVELADQLTPSCSYQNVLIKDEPNESVGVTCINQFDESFVKEETEII